MNEAMDLYPILSTVNGIVAIVVVLGLCLFVHEAGHFAAAKLFGCRVHEFALGFGPPILKIRRGETEYRLNIFPLGGYVRIAGMEPGAEDVEGGFHSIPRWQGAIVIAAGVFMNMVLAFIVFAFVALSTGVSDPSDGRILVRKVLQGTPAQRAGLLPGDEIIAVNGSRHSMEVQSLDPDGAAAKAGLNSSMMIEAVEDNKVYLPAAAYESARRAEGKTVKVTAIDTSVEDLTRQLRYLELPKPPPGGAEDPDVARNLLEKSWGLGFNELTRAGLVGAISERPEEPVTLTINRDGQTQQVTLTPAVEYARYPVREPNGSVRTPHRAVGRMGTVIGASVRPIGVVEAGKEGMRRSYGAVMMVVFGIKAMLSKHIESGAGGPVAIMAMSAEQARLGWDAVFNWLAIISANLAVINLAPIPPFDGFRILLLGFEGTIKRRIDEQKELILTLAGFVVIICFIVLVTFQDIVNLVRYGTP
ncbi:MAG: site-2 protease family protein [Armatimonadota bacterium]